MKNKWLKYVIVIAIIIGCISLDQVSKLIAIKHLSEYSSVTVINNFFYWTLCYNTGGAWSIFSNSTWLLVIISLMALGLIIFLIIKSKSKLFIVSASIFSGGLIGNLIDRLFQGKVTDFINFVIFGYDFPVFNLADIFIVISAIFILLALVKEEKENGTKDSN